MLATEGARCARHPDDPAVTVCERCGTFCCGACALKAGLCRDCGLKLPPSPASVASAVIGAVSFCGLFPLGLVAVVLGFVELSRVKRGTASPRSADWAQGGRALGGVAVLIGLLALYAWSQR